MNINTEKKLIKEVTLSHETERKSFETKMKVRNLQPLKMIIHPLTVFRIRIQLGRRIGIRIQANRNWPSKEEKLRKFMFKSLNFLSLGFKKTYMTVFAQKHVPK
jgi:hypothetical protein